MGTGTVGGYNLTHVTHIEASTPKRNVEHDIPGGGSIVQVLGWKRSVIKIHGILSPLTEVDAVRSIEGLGNLATITASVSIGGRDWASLLNWCIESVDVTTLPGVAAEQPWGYYTITLKEVS